MRSCSSCQKADAPWFEQAACSCGVFKADDDDPSPLKHADNCTMIGHEVVLYPVRIDKRDLTWDGKLPAYYAAKGWKLVQNGMKHYRAKYLCRDCIQLEDGAQARRKEYERACKAARGEETKSYAQMLASQ